MTLTALAPSHPAVASSFSAAIDHVAQGFEGLGALVLVVGVVWSFVLAVVAWRRSGSGQPAYAALRKAFGGSLLLSLEILVAADLLRTVAVAPTVENVLVLGLIVLIRTFLSFSLEIEIDGVVPWRRALVSGAATVAQATQAALGRRPADPENGA
ncbi:MAG TPA: DUF1622 domain-containing protein [Streptosporangiaceae bacterium]|nr:DUF1622 domain-containing protein [Streptosporangiaceae bacterium]